MSVSGNARVNEHKTAYCIIKTAAGTIASGCFNGSNLLATVQTKKAKHSSLYVIQQQPFRVSVHFLCVTEILN